MRIISSFKDYYDSAMGYGVDYDSVWLREEKEIKRGPGPRGPRTYQHQNIDFKYSSHNIAFCGKLYGCVKVAKLKEGRPVIEAICYKIEDIDKFVEANFKKKQIKYYYEHNKSSSFSYSRRAFESGMYYGNRKAFEFFFKEIDKYSEDKVEKFLIENNTPICVDNQLNAFLKDWEFYRVVDPYTAFQEIQMFFGRLRSPERPIPYVSDADMLEAKGFDPKWSFRREPGKKKKKK